jgi:hypothetical protein
MRRATIALLAGLVLAALLPSSALAQLKLDQSNTTDGYGFIFGPYRAQTFTVGISGPLARVDLNLTEVEADGHDVTVQIENLSSKGQPSGYVYSSATVHVRSPSWYHFNFSSPHTFQKGTHLAIVIHMDWAGIIYGSSDRYPYGAAMRLVGNKWRTLPYDYEFKTYVNVTSPTPSPSRTPTPRPTATHTATPRPTATHTATPKPTATPKRISTPRPIATPKRISTPQPTASPALTSSPRPSPSPGSTASVSPASIKPSLSPAAPTASIRPAGTPAPGSSPGPGPGSDQNVDVNVALMSGLALFFALLLGGIGLVMGHRR